MIEYIVECISRKAKLKPDSKDARVLISWVISKDSAFSLLSLMSMNHWFQSENMLNLTTVIAGFKFD